MSSEPKDGPAITGDDTLLLTLHHVQQQLAGAEQRMDAIEQKQAQTGTAPEAAAATSNKPQGCDVMTGRTLVAGPQLDFDLSKISVEQALDQVRQVVSRLSQGHRDRLEQAFIDHGHDAASVARVMERHRAIDQEALEEHLKTVEVELRAWLAETQASGATH